MAELTVTAIKAAKPFKLTDEKGFYRKHPAPTVIPPFLAVAKSGVKRSSPVSALV